MELRMDYKEGSLIFDTSGNMYLVSFKTLYNLVLIKFESAVRYDEPYSQWQNNLPLFTWKNYNLTNRDDINYLNGKFDGSEITVSTLGNYKKVYDVEIGSVVEFDYKQMMLVGKTDRKILTFMLTRPVLFDFDKAKEKYIVFDRLNKLGDLQSEFDSNWSEYLITPFASKQNIDWSVVRDKLPFEEVIGKEFIEKEFVQTPTEDITLEDFYEVINTKKLNEIKDESIKNEIIELIKQTLILAKENNSIGSKLEPKKSVVPIVESVDENAGKNLYKIKVVLKELDKDGGYKHDYFYDIYADSETEALEKIRKQYKDDEDFKFTELSYFSDEVIEVIPATKKVVKLSNLKKGDRFTFPLSQEDINMGVTEMIYVFDSKAKSTFFYKSGDSEFSTSENREVNLLSSKEPVLEKPIEDTDNLEDLLSLYPIEETENLNDLLKLYE